MARTRSLAFVAVVVLLAAPGASRAAVTRLLFSGPQGHVRLEVLADDLVHVEFAAGTTADTGPIYASPMVAKRDHAGPKRLSREKDVLSTRALRVRVDRSTLCVSFDREPGHVFLTTVCPQHLADPLKTLTFARGEMTHAYGLGQQFRQLGSADGDWTLHQSRDAGDFGNTFTPFGQAGMVGNVQIPVLFALGPGKLTYGLLIDNVYRQSWSFTGDPWTLQTYGDQLRFYFTAGADLPAARGRLLELVGLPPVPPRKAFGLWVSQFGYRGWGEIDALASGLREAGFPLDGFVLDLYWFGGVHANQADTHMGTLAWDEAAFPGPSAKIAQLAADHIGLITIEESYIGKSTDTYAALSPQGLLAWAPAGGACAAPSPASVELDAWFGVAGMVDWSNPQAGAWVHEHRRLPNLVQPGIVGHWCDLGEPEKFDPGACYAGVETTPAGVKNRHADVHNLYALLWVQSVFDGYRSHAAPQGPRPFVLSRSGAAGLQRFGAAMWSGDIGGNLDLLATHLNAQLHMSLAGIDYYGADVGGFRREALPCNGKHGDTRYESEMYTQWLANAAWFDVPVRPHTDNSFQTAAAYRTAPHLVGDVASNRDNLRQRYALIPYYYALAHRAYEVGEPVIPPLVYYYQDDPQVRRMGHEKLIGKDLLVAVVAKHGEYARGVYLPAGRWVDIHTREWFTGGRWIADYPVYLAGRLTLPAFARAGAIIPGMRVDAPAVDASGPRADPGSPGELVVSVFAGPGRSAFTVYEDDGRTVRYGGAGRPVYQTRRTEIVQERRPGGVRVTIGAAQGTYDGAPGARDALVRLVVDGASATAVTLNGVALPEASSAAGLEGPGAAWRNAGRNVVEVRTGPQAASSATALTFSLKPVTQASSMNFVCDNGWTAAGERIYVVGNVGALGGWNPEAGFPLDPSVSYAYVAERDRCGPGPSAPIWTGFAPELPPGTDVEWKCVRRAADGSWQWQGGSNNVARTAPGGFSGTARGAF